MMLLAQSELEKPLRAKGPGDKVKPRAKEPLMYLSNLLTALKLAMEGLCMC